MSNFVARRGQLKGILTRFWNYVTTPDNDVNQIHIRKEKVEEVWQEFNRIQAEIELEIGEGENINEHYQYREEFEELYYKAITEANRRIHRTENISGTVEYNRDEDSERKMKEVNPMVKLAALNVPIFSGVYAEWASFYDIYTALIHNNDSISTIQKFFYLRSSLSEGAAECIKNIETTANNYLSAWSNLISRYNNKKLLVQTHVRAICDLPTVKGKSSSSLRQFSDNLRGHLAALKTLNQRPSEWGPLLLHVVCSKLDTDTISEWEIKTPIDELAKVDDLIEFLDSRFRVLEAVESAKNMNKSVNTVFEYKNTNRKNKFERNSMSLAVTAEIKCFICNQSHTIYKCPTFVAMSVDNRIKKTYELGLCKICLRRHEKRKCFARHCFKCAKAHNTMLHIGTEHQKLSTTTAVGSSSNTAATDTTVITSVNAHASVAIEHVLLSTAVVLAVNVDGNTLPCRVLLDSGSQTNFITEELVQTLHLKKNKIEHVISGIGETSQRATSSVWAKIKSRINDYTLNLQMVVVPKITGHLPNHNVKTKYNIPNNIKLADPSFNEPQKIDVLIGAAHFYDILRGGQKRPNPTGPLYQETVFGWVAAGPVLINSHANMMPSSAAFLATHGVMTLEHLLQQFWIVEDMGNEATYTPEERACEDHFNKTVTRSKIDGRFVVKLPFRENAKRLGKSYEIAKRRLLVIERKFKGNQDLKTEYISFMDEYERLGHMELVNEDTEVEGKMCYLPHHAVRKEDSTSTKLRVVFDASCKTQTGASLNDVLMKGPAIQNEIIYILARFRTHNYVVTADIAKMYRQIVVAEEHRDWQRILWRTMPEALVQTYRLNTVTYGTVPASYIATACLKKLAETNSMEYPKAAAAIIRDFYMDDFLSGAETKDEAATLIRQLIDVMNSAGMKLRKWSSNDIDLLKSILPDEDIELSNYYDIGGSTKKILGLYWDAHTDKLRFKMSPGVGSTTAISKRDILSDIASIFDPLGLVGPVVIRAKIMLQALWREKVNWDEPIPIGVREEWLKYRNLLPALNNLSISRKILGDLSVGHIEIHGFSDASEVAYGCCLYVRYATGTGSYSTSLICAKSKVAPIKTLSIPRLELCAALLLSRLAAKIIPKLQLNIKRRYFWTDSTIVLAWISSPAANWKVFVGNRVSEIQDKTSCSEWRHISSKENPADVISRGCCPSKLTENVLWWTGPEWIR
uniref:Uncharacterized protein n=1 Tax=Sipha flava TaxID=143950 RepID=A0A2S2QB76_9HEMI